MMESKPIRWLKRELLRIKPTTKTGKLTLYVLALRLFVAVGALVTEKLQGVASATGWDGWAIGFDFLLFLLGSVLVFRWFRRRFLWRVRNRLIVTYVFIGVVPVVLAICMSLIASYLFLNQYATSQARTEVEKEVNRLEVVNSGLAGEITEMLSMGGQVRADSVAKLGTVRHQDRRFPQWQVTLWQNGKPQLVHGDTMVRQLEEPNWKESRNEDIVVEDGKLYLRAIALVDTTPAAHLVSVVPLTSKLLDTTSQGLGEIQIYLPNTVNNVGATAPPAGASASSNNLVQEKKTPVLSNTATKKGLRLSGTDAKNGNKRTDFTFSGQPDAAGGSVTGASRGFYDPIFTFTTIYPYVDLGSKTSAAAILQVKTRPSILVDRLFANMGVFASAIIGALGALAVVFSIFLLAALFIGAGLTKTITGSVYNLYRATQHVNLGDFGYRIEVKAKDQLGDLQNSFNNMSANIERLIEQQKEKERLENELAIAQEVQNTLFPLAQKSIPSLELHGICKPARTVSGDYYDFLHCGNERLGIALGDISGKGISAALLMATLHSAVRAYEYGSEPMESDSGGGFSSWSHGQEDGDGVQVAVASRLESPSRVMELLNRHLFHSTQAEKYATLFLAIFDGDSRELTYCNAGHLPPLIVAKDGTVRKLDSNGMVIGLFYDVAFDQSIIRLQPGDIFVAFSDGVTEPENEFGEFGEHRLIDVIRENRHLPLDRISEAVTTAVQDWIGSSEQPDDVTLVLARAR